MYIQLTGNSVEKLKSPAWIKSENILDYDLSEFVLEDSNSEDDSSSSSSTNSSDTYTSESTDESDNKIDIFVIINKKGTLPKISKGKATIIKLKGD